MILLRLPLTSLAEQWCLATLAILPGLQDANFIASVHELMTLLGLMTLYETHFLPGSSHIDTAIWVHYMDTQIYAKLMSTKSWWLIQQLSRIDVLIKAVRTRTKALSCQSRTDERMGTKALSGQSRVDEQTGTKALSGQSRVDERTRAKALSGQSRADEQDGNEGFVAGQSRAKPWASGQEQRLCRVKAVRTSAKVRNEGFVRSKPCGQARRPRLRLALS